MPALQRHPLLLLVPLLALCCAAQAEPARGPAAHYPETDEIDALLSAAEPPEGVVFNVMEYEQHALDGISERLRHYVARLRTRYPDLPIAVVSHGAEMFALRAGDRLLHPELRQRVRRLVRDHDVVFHVCGANAAANGVDESEFPRYVDVVPLAPAQIADYREFGYEMISIGEGW